MAGVALQGAYDVVVSPDGRHVYVAGFDGASVAAFARLPDGSLRQLVGSAACVAEEAFEQPCSPATALHQPSSIAISPDGRSVYVTAFRSHGVSVFARNVATGALTQLAGEAGCVSQHVTESTCAPGVGLFGALGVAVSSDGRNVYVTAVQSDGVASFRRDPSDGRLVQLAAPLGCTTETAPLDDHEETAECRAGVGLVNAGAIAVSRDGRNVYVASNAVAVFARDPATGALFQLNPPAACVSETGNDGDCTDGRGLAGPFSIAISRDGRTVYVASGFDIEADEPLAAGGVAVFRRDPASGALSQLEGRAGCISSNGTGGECATGRGLLGAQHVTVSPDGANVYTVSAAENAIGAFARSPATGALVQLQGLAGCLSDAGSGGACAEAVGFRGVSALAVSPDGRNAYAASIYDHALAVLARSSRTTVLRFRARLRPLRGASQASGTAELELETTSRQACWKLALTNVRRPSGAVLVDIGTRDRRTRLGTGFARTGCTTIAARWVSLLRTRPGTVSFEVRGGPIVRGRLARVRA